MAAAPEAMGKPEKRCGGKAKTSEFVSGRDDRAKLPSAVRKTTAVLFSAREVQQW
jgi:hypothetical protein